MHTHNLLSALALVALGVAPVASTAHPSAPPAIHRRSQRRSPSNFFANLWERRLPITATTTVTVDATSTRVVWVTATSYPGSAIPTSEPSANSTTILPIPTEGLNATLPLPSSAVETSANYTTTASEWWETSSTSAGGSLVSPTARPNATRTEGWIVIPTNIASLSENQTTSSHHYDASSAAASEASSLASYTDVSTTLAPIVTGVSSTLSGESGTVSPTMTNSTGTVTPSATATLVSSGSVASTTGESQSTRPASSVQTSSGVASSTGVSSTQSAVSSGSTVISSSQVTSSAAITSSPSSIQVSSSSSAVSASKTESATLSAPTSVRTDLASSGWKALGCAVDEGGRVLSDYFVARRDMTIDSCLDICGRKGFKYAGLEYGEECMCGNSLKQGVSYDSSAYACSTPCAGDTSKTCGGGWRMDVYQLVSAEQTSTRASLSNTSSRTASATVSAPTSANTNIPDASKWSELGCAVDEGGRILADYYVSRSDMTVDRCLDICQGAGFKYAGVEYGQECMCGKTLKNGVAYDSNAYACSTPCAGDATKICGGGWRMGLYEFGSSPGPSATVIKPTSASVSSSASVIVSTTRTTSSTAAIPSTTAGSSLSTTPLNDRIVAGYYPDWSVWTFPPTQLDFDRIDVVDFAFAIVNAQYGLEFTQYNSEDTLNWLVRLAHAKGKKVRLSIGGWTGSVYFSPAVATDRNRQVLAEAILAMYQKFNLDGIDLDWEYPGVKGADNNIVTSQDSANYLIFLRLLRKTLPPTAILSAATQVWPFAGPNGAPLSDVSEFAKLLDWVMIMNYDIWGSSATTPGPNAPLNNGCGNSAQPLANAYAAVSSWTTAGMPAKQIVLGLPAYGYMQESRADSLRTRKRRSLEKKGGVTLYNADGGTSYGQIKFGDMINQGGLSRDSSGHWVGSGGFTRYWDTCSSTPWLKSSESGQIITYDDPISISLKAQFARQAGLRGTNFWEITGDSRDWSLLDAARSGLGL